MFVVTVETAGFCAHLSQKSIVRDIFGSRDCPGLDRVIFILSLGGVLPKSCTQYILVLEAQ